MKATQGLRVRTGRGGLTLVELMVTVAIIGILASVSLAMLSRRDFASASRRAALEFQDTMQRMQARAMSRGRTVYLQFEAFGSGTPGRIRAWDGPSNLCLAAEFSSVTTATPSYVFNFDTGGFRDVAIVELPFAAQGHNGSLCFRPNGRVGNPAGNGQAYPPPPDALFGGPQTLGGRYFARIGPVICGGGGCTEVQNGALRQLLGISYGGQVDVIQN